MLNYLLKGWLKKLVERNEEGLAYWLMAVSKVEEEMARQIAGGLGEWLTRLYLCSSPSLSLIAS